LLDAWADLLDAGDHDGVLRLLEAATKDTPGLPPLADVWAAAATADDDTAARRAYETAAAAEAASRRTALVDGQGRAYATGRRKEATARVWVRKGGGSVRVNGVPLDAFFASLSRRADVLSPFVVTDTLGGFDVRATVTGGGTTGQAQAVRHGVARALQLYDPSFRPPLKAAGLLTRDPRAVERKKPGRAKARKAFQWVKR
jgi:small subunit ribosomal protein S9